MMVVKRLFFNESMSCFSINLRREIFLRDQTKKKKELIRGEIEALSRIRVNQQEWSNRVRYFQYRNRKISIEPWNQISIDGKSARHGQCILNGERCIKESIGYWIQDYEWDEDAGIRTITKAMLFEGSLVSYGNGDGSGSGDG